MSFITFDEHYQLGHQEIDDQHAKLFRAVNQLYDAMLAGHAREELDNILRFLRAYTIKHFATEEKLMEQTVYPGYRKHKAIHEQLTQQVADLVDKHQAGQVTLSLDVFNFLRDWLAVHIDQEDRRMVGFLHSKGL